MLIKGKLQNLSEDDLRKKIVMPLMRAFGALSVRDWHGRSEKGIDVLYKKENDFNEMVYKGILLKAVKINQRIYTSTLRVQIEQATGRSFPDPDYPENEIKIHALTVMTSFHITQDVRELIKDLAGKVFPSVEIVDGDRLCGFIDRIIDEYNEKESKEQYSNYYEFEVETFQGFCDMYRNRIYPKKIIDTPSTIRKITKTFEEKEVGGEKIDSEP